MNLKKFMLRDTIAKLLFLNLITLITYLGIYRLDFQLQWDDYWVVINEYTNKGFTIDNMLAVMFDFYHGQYSPVNELYYISLKSLFGYNSAYFHAIGLLIHIINVNLIYFFIIRIVPLLKQDKILKDSKIAFFTALVFSLHPLNLEAVAWLAASKVLLYAMFYLLALHSYLAYLKSNSTLHLTYTIVAFSFSFLSKEQAVTLPLCLLLLDYLHDRDLKSIRVWSEKILMFGLSVSYGIITIRSQGVTSSEDFEYYSLNERLILSFFTLVEYVSKALAPIKLSYIYPFPFLPDEHIPAWLFIYPLIILLMILFIGKLILKSKWVLFSVAFFILHIAIALNLLNLSRYSWIADRYAYLSTIGSSFFIVYGMMAYGYQRRFNKLVTLGLGIYILVLGIYTNLHLPVWKNSKTLKEGISSEIRNRADYDELEKKYEDQ